MTPTMPREPWRESLEDHDRGGWRGVMRRVFGDGENPLAWGFGLYSAWGIRVRVHLLFVFYIVAEVIRSLLPDQPGLMYIAPLLIALFGLVLLHEYGHCVVCRLVGGDADEILIWPLGGLAMCLPPHRWKANLWTTAGGPLVNAILLVPLGLLCYAVTHDLGAVIFNPFNPMLAASAIAASSSLLQMLKLFVWSLHYANMLLLAFNLIVPMYPMDAGRLLQEVLWAKIGYRESMRVAAIVGIAVALFLAVIAITFDGMQRLLAIALLGGYVCFMELRRLKFEAAEDPGVFAAAYPEAEDEAGPTRSETRRQEREAAEKAEVDRILDKISASGMDSLSSKEKRTLERASGKG
ncbi:MAG: hypothetical protein H6810_01165 [Phycisphaeraceae bacterium]|nr:MAG: hypothetical protein H6810_01165 [Phycisphaeraceae bacterium]